MQKELTSAGILLAKNSGTFFDFFPSEIRDKLIQYVLPDCDKYTPLIINIFGEPRVGKSTLINSYVSETYVDSHSKPDPEFLNKFFLMDDQIVKLILMLQAWPNREELKDMGPSGANGTILVFDTTDSSSFQAMEKDLKILKETYPKRYGYKIFVVGTKADLIEKRQVTEDMIHKFEEAHQIHIRLVSAKNGLDYIHTMFESFTAAIFATKLQVENSIPQKMKEQQPPANKSNCSIS